MTTQALNPKIALTANVLKLTFSLVPIIAGLDKFFNLLTQWDHYLAPSLVQMLPFSTGVFFGIIGVIEIAAGLLVLKMTRIGSYVVMAWLILIALTLIMNRMYDVAVRDLVMAVGAFTLAQLSDEL